MAKIFPVRSRRVENCSTWMLDGVRSVKGILRATQTKLMSPDSDSDFGYGSSTADTCMFS